MEHQLPVQVLVSVSKRNFKNAVDRNRIKRLIKAAIKREKVPAGEVKIIVKNNIQKLKMDEVSNKLKNLFCIRVFFL